MCSARFCAVGIVVSLVVAWISFYLSPMCLRELRRWATEVRAEIVTSNVQPGRFIVVDGRLTLHIRAREPNGQLLGIMVDDQRDPKERGTIFAEQGDLLSNERGIFLLLENGTVQRHEAGKQRSGHRPVHRTMRFDLSRLSPASGQVTFAIHERSISGNCSTRDRRSDVHAISPGSSAPSCTIESPTPLYPLAFLLVTFAFLGAPRTTRQSRAMSLIGAIAVVAVLRGLGFVGTISGAHSPIALARALSRAGRRFVLGGWAMSRGVVIEPPAFVTNADQRACSRASRGAPRRQRGSTP